VHPLLIPILTYHIVTRRENDYGYSVSEREFTEHLEFLSRNGFRTVSISEYFAFLSNTGRNVPLKSVLITFDDGHESDFQLALAILKRFSFTATCFVTTDWIGKPGYMSADQLKLMEEEGMSIESHCKTHSFLSSLDPGQASLELHASKATLERILGKTVNFVSFPGGRYNKMVIERALQAGYSGLFSSEPFGFKALDFSSFLAGRSMVKKGTGLKRLQELISARKSTIFRERCLYFGKSALKRVTPESVYKKLWNMYIRK